MILRNGIVGVVTMFHGSVESRMFHQELLSPLAMEVEDNERPHPKGC